MSTTYLNSHGRPYISRPTGQAGNPSLRTQELRTGSLSEGGERVFDEQADLGEGFVDGAGGLDQVAEGEPDDDLAEPGDGLATDRERAVTLLRLGCDGGDGPGQHRFGPGGDQRPQAGGPRAPVGQQCLGQR